MLQPQVLLSMPAQQPPAMMQMPAQQLPSMPPAQMPGMPGAQQLSLEDLQAMEQFVEAERAKMTDEQRAQFDNDVIQLTKEFEKMQAENPEQFASFIDQMLFGQPTEETAPEQIAPAQQPEFVPAPAQQPEEQTKKQIDVEKQDEALRRINTIIKHTSSFLNKTAMMIEFPGKLKKWAEQGKIRGWIAGYAWESVKNNVGIKEQLERLLQKLNALKEQDRATKTYKYLDALIAKEELYKNLGSLANKLKELEPQVEIDEFGLEPASKEVRAIMRTILGEYMNALFAQSMPQDIDAVIAAFEPTAEKYRKEEEESSKKAIEDSKRFRPAKSTVVAGHPEDNYGYGSNSGMNPYDYFPYSNQQYQPTGDSGSGQIPAQEKKQDDKKGGEGDKGKGGSENKPKEEDTKDSADDKKIRSGIEQLRGNLTEASEAIDRMVDLGSAKISAEELNNTVKKLKQATGNLNSLKVRISKASTDKKRSRFKEEIREERDLNKDSLNKVSKITGSVSGSGDKKAKATLPPKPTKPTVTISQEEAAKFKAQAKNDKELLATAEEQVNAEIEQAINIASAKAQRAAKTQEARAAKGQEPADGIPLAPELDEETIDSFYRQQRPEMLKEKTEKLVQEKADQLMKLYRDNEQKKADDKYQEALNAWDAQAAKNASEESKEEVVSYSLKDLDTAAQEVLKGFSGF
jgi:hypothetical protein